MLTNKIFSLLQTFDKDEINSFDKFICSPYFNHSQKLSLLCKEIIKYYPSFDHKNLNKERLSKQISKKGRYNESTLRGAFAELLKKGEEFLAIENFRKDEYDSYKHLLKVLNDKNQNELFIKNLNKIQNKLPFNKTESSIFFYNKFLIEAEKYNYSCTHENIHNRKLLKNELDNITMAGVYLTMFYIEELVSAYLNILFYSQDFTVEKTNNPLSILLKSIDIKKIMRIVNRGNEYGFVLGIYYSMLRCFKDLVSNDSIVENDIYYFKYKRLLKKYSDRLSADELSFHYSKLISYCLLKVLFSKSQLVPDFNNELFQIYKETITKGYYKNHKIDHLSIDMYRNILIHAIKLEKYDWAENFIKQYSKKVHLNYRKYSEYFGFAYLYNSLSKYNESIQCLNKIPNEYIIFKYDINNLYLKDYYELNYFEEALSRVHSYRQLLANDNILTIDRKIRYKKFINYYEKLVFYKLGKTKKALTIDRLSSENDVAYKNWLLSKYTQVKLV